MMKKISLVLFLMLMILGAAQTSTNTHILNEAGEKLPDAVNFCPGESFNLKVDAVATSTGDYTISKDSPSAFDLSAGRNLIKFNIAGSNSDKFSEPIDIGFNFSFYGNTYTHVVAGNNGRLVFTNSSELQNLKDNNIYKDRTFSGKITGTPVPLPSKDYNKVYLADPLRELPLAQIFFGFTDLYKASGVATTYTYRRGTFLSQPGILISYGNEIQNGATGFSGSVFHSSVLLLQDGRIVIYVYNKTEANYNAILGIQNHDGNKKQVPIHSNAAYNYNNGKWKSEGIAWIFTPSLTLTPKVEWFVNGNPTNVNPTPNSIFNTYLPTDGDKIEAKISYIETPSASPITSSVVFKKYQSPTITATPGTGCGAGTTLAVSNPIPGATYTWHSSANPAYSATGTSVVAVSSGTYYAVINGCVAAKSNEVNVAISSALTPAGFVSGYPFKECDTLGLTSKNFNLSTLVNYPPGSGYVVEFLDGSGALVANAANEYMVSLNSGETKNFRLKVSSTITTCFIDVPFSVSYVSFPIIAKDYKPLKLCYENIDYTTAQFKSEFFPNTNFDVKFSTDNVHFNLNQINPHTATPVYVKIKHPDFSCESVGNIIFEFHPEIIAKPYTQFPAHCFSSTEYFDLDITKTELEYDDVTAEFYTSYDAATKTFSDRITNLHYRPSGKYTVYVRLKNSFGCTYAGTPPVMNLEIYRPPNLIKTTPETKYAACGTNIFNLTTNISDYIGTWSHYSEIRYYDASNRLLTMAETTRYDSSVSGQPYMVFVYNETNNLECSSRIDFDLKYNPLPTVLTNQIPVCSETAYSKTAFLTKILGKNYRDYTVGYADGSAIPESIPLGALPYKISIKIKNNATLCESGTINITFAQGNPTSVNSDIPEWVKCDIDFDGKTLFNLNDWIPKITSATNPVIEYFTDAARTRKIVDPVNYKNLIAEETIYGTVTTDSTCPTNFQFNLKVNTPTKSTTLQDKYLMCFGEQVFVDAGSENELFLWSDGQKDQMATFSKAGNYSVKLTNAGCSYTHNFVISDENQPKISQINQSNDRIEVIAQDGVKPYEYSFDGGATWQVSNILMNPALHEYHIQVRSTVAPGIYCPGEMKSIYTITVNNVITPNGDGNNDFWMIKNLDKMENPEIIITDRYGKSVFNSAKNNTLIWDGKADGRELPTSTYWYTLKWRDPATNKNEVRSGWILLKNRN